MGNMFEIYCSIAYGPRNSLTNFERATFTTVSPSSKLLVPVSFSWGDTSYGTDVGDMQEIYYYNDGGEGRYRLDKCAVAEKCSSCEICPDGVSTAIDCQGLSPDLGYDHTCEDDVGTTTFFAAYFENNAVALVMDENGSSHYGVFGSSGAERRTRGAKMLVAVAVVAPSIIFYSIFGG